MLFVIRQIDFLRDYLDIRGSSAVPALTSHAARCPVHRCCLPLTLFRYPLLLPSCRLHIFRACFELMPARLTPCSSASRHHFCRPRSLLDCPDADFLFFIEIGPAHHAVCHVSLLFTGAFVLRCTTRTPRGVRRSAHFAVAFRRCRRAEESDERAHRPMRPTREVRSHASRSVRSSVQMFCVPSESRCARADMFMRAARCARGEKSVRVVFYRASRAKTMPDAMAMAPDFETAPARPRNDVA